MTFQPHLVILYAGACALLAAIPAALQTLRRPRGVIPAAYRGIHRAPMVAFALTAALLSTGFDRSPAEEAHLFMPLEPATAVAVQWLGALVFLYGAWLLVSGWYSWNNRFGHEADFQDPPGMYTPGALDQVLHPVLSGGLLALIGAGIAQNACLALFMTVVIVLPLGLRKARYDEIRMVDLYGDHYRQYADSIGWRRLVPRWIPMGF